MELTPLQRKIKASALLTIRRMKPTLVEYCKEPRARYYKFVSMCDGVCDLITLDTQTKEFEVEYPVGKGEGIGLGFERQAAYFDETIDKKIKFTAPINFIN